MNYLNLVIYYFPTVVFFVLLYGFYKYKEPYLKWYLIIVGLSLVKKILDLFNFNTATQMILSRVEMLIPLLQLIGLIYMLFLYKYRRTTYIENPSFKGYHRVINKKT